MTQPRFEIQTKGILRPGGHGKEVIGKIGCHARTVGAAELDPAILRNFVELLQRGPFQFDAEERLDDPDWATQGCLDQVFNLTST